MQSQRLRSSVVHAVRTQSSLSAMGHSKVRSYSLHTCVLILSMKYIHKSGSVWITEDFILIINQLNSYQMEWKIGEVKQVNREWYQCVEANENDNCNSCDLQGLCIRMQGKQHVGNCTNWRTDNKRAIFKKLEKVGRPFERNGYMYQEYKAHTYPLLISESATIPTHNGFAVIIKQNKEDMEDLDKINVMEEKKLNLKPFDIQKAREGKPVCTRDGRKARIICFDSTLENYPLVVLVGDYPYPYTAEGKSDKDSESSSDLMMLSEKRSGWVNLTGSLSHNPHILDIVWNTKEEALDFRRKAPINANIIATGKITWEE